MRDTIFQVLATIALIIAVAALMVALNAGNRASGAIERVEDIESDDRTLKPRRNWRTQIL